MVSLESTITRRWFLVAGVAAGALPIGARLEAGEATFEVTHTEAEWRRLLTERQYAVLRESDTEPPFTSPLLDEKRRGVFGCAGCRLDLFSSTTKLNGIALTFRATAA